MVSFKHMMRMSLGFTTSCNLKPLENCVKVVTGSRSSNIM